MHAALISLILMSGACGQASPEAIPGPPREMMMGAPEFDSWLCPPPVSVSEAPIHVPTGCGVIGCRSCNYLTNPYYRCCHNCEPVGACTTPAWETDYRPACYFYPEHRLLFHPADYTMPYDYRERFNYPWHDPRCPCAALPLEN